MKGSDLKSMSVDELWDLHERVTAKLSHKMAAERSTLEQRLLQLRPVARSGVVGRERRPYPKVMPKYRNPRNQHETWAGRGKTPRWLRAQLRSGKKLDDFLIGNARA